MVPYPSCGDVSTAFARAIIAASQAPVLLLDGKMIVVAASESFLVSYGFTAHDVEGRSLLQIGGGTWNLPRVRAMLSVAASDAPEQDACEIDIATADGRHRNLVLKARRLEFMVAGPVRVMLTVVDGTEARVAARLKDDLIRDKDILLREVQHRVANSLQIIASVLLQNARKVGSEESRAHLRDAHQRIMSVAAVQQQLAVSSLGEVALKPYLTQLCDSISASMIEDHDLVSIEVSGDGSATSGETSVSVGLIVTELVLNALKHAFPEAQKGTVTVDYHSGREGWALSVCDDGVGMPFSPNNTKGGLGSAIVQALAAQLSATITVADLHPGTGISVVHRDRGTALELAGPAAIRAV